MEGSTNIGHRSIDGRSIQCVIADLEVTGFQVLLHEDLACGERAYITPWYEYLREAIGTQGMFHWKYSSTSSRRYVELTRDAASVLQQAGVVRVRNHTYWLQSLSQLGSYSMVMPDIHPHGDVCRSKIG